MRGVRRTETETRILDQTVQSGNSATRDNGPSVASSRISHRCLGLASLRVGEEGNTPSTGEMGCFSELADDFYGFLELLPRQGAIQAKAVSESVAQRK
jgi:hypothetical protein